MKRKTFIANAGILLSGIPFVNPTLSNANKKSSDSLTSLKLLKSENSVNDESYWNMVRTFFNYPKDFINLENGYFSPQPISTVQFHQKKEHLINHKTSWYMRREQNEAVEQSRQTLADFLGCEAEELVITRNTTESLNTVISGYPWKKGDEVIIGNQDYGSMVAAFEQQAKRYEIVIKTAQIPLHPKSDDELIDAYISLVTAKTKIIHLTHMINLSGQLLPAAKITEAAHSKGVEVMIDAAHSIAQVNFKPGELGADYLGASLHKWLCCPLGAGILIIKRKHIAKIWPLMGDSDFPTDNVRKFQHQGTRPIQTILAIDEAIRFHNTIGSELKESRLRYLKNRWVNAVKDLPQVILNTPVDDDSRSCAIANFGIKNYTPQQLADKLLADYKIFTVAIDHPFIKGVRVTPHLYNSPEDIDKLIEAIKSL